MRVLRPWKILAISATAKNRRMVLWSEQSVREVWEHAPSDPETEDPGRGLKIVKFETK